MELNERKAKRGKQKASWRIAVLLSFGLCAFSFQPAQAQTFAEWFEQGKTLIKYLGTQIAYLELYDRGLMQGYNEAKGDLGLIRNWKNGEMGLHSDYYTSLGQVNPEVLAATDVSSIRSEAMSLASQLEGLK